MTYRVKSDRHVYIKSVAVWRRGFYNPHDAHRAAWHRIGPNGRPLCGSRAPRGGGDEVFQSDNIMPKGAVCEKCEEME